MFSVPCTTDVTVHVEEQGSVYRASPSCCATTFWLWTTLYALNFSKNCSTKSRAWQARLVQYVRFVHNKKDIGKLSFFSFNFPSDTSAFLIISIHSWSGKIKLWDFSWMSWCLYCQYNSVFASACIISLHSVWRPDMKHIWIHLRQR